MVDLLIILDVFNLILMFKVLHDTTLMYGEIYLISREKIVKFVIALIVIQLILICISLYLPNHLVG